MLVVQVLSLLAASLVVSAHPRPAKRALPLLGGVNVAGLDFGMDTNGQNNNVYVPPPVAQISHFSKLGANLFRIPFGWQYLTGTSGGNIIDSFFQILDTPVQAALNASPSTYVILDMHNYARFKGLKIGTQVSGADFANTWGQLAAKYKSNPRVMFGLVNEPHDLSDSEFAAFVSAMQLAVNAIRSAGATSQYILLPGNDWDHPNELINKWGDVLINGVTDPNGGSSLLLIDAHQYLDADGSGTGNYCTTDNVDLFKRFAAWLKTKNRQAIVTETGAAWQNADCVTKMNAQLAYIRSVPEQIVGFTAWSAGAFDPDYVLSLVPDANGNDNAMVKGALVPNFPGANAPIISTSSAPVTPSATPVSTSRPPVITTASSISTSNPPLTSSTSAPSTGTAGPWGQCGGTGWTGPTTCTTGWTCKVSNQWYSQCLQ